MLAITPLNKVINQRKINGSLEMNGAENPTNNNPLDKSELKLANNFAWAGLNGCGIN